MKTDDMSKVEALTTSPNIQIPWSFTADGTRLAYLEPSESSFLDLWTIPVSHAAGTLTAGEPELFLRTPYVESAPSISPDGRWLVYGWGQHPNWEVYVRPFPSDDSTETFDVHGDRILGLVPTSTEEAERIRNSLTVRPSFANEVRRRLSGGGR